MPLTLLVKAGSSFTAFCIGFNRIWQNQNSTPIFLGKHLPNRADVEFDDDQGGKKSCLPGKMRLNNLSTRNSINLYPQQVFICYEDGASPFRNPGSERLNFSCFLEERMPRPLQKQTRNGVAYVRRPDVEAEISELENLEVDQLLERCQLSLGSKAGSVSPEALLYFVRTIDADNPHLGQLANILIGFIKRQLPNPYSYDGESTDLYKEMISDLVIDPFVLRLFCDRSEYQEQLDFYEVNFYRAIAKDRMDAYSKAYESRNRSVELLNEDQEISSEVEKAVGNDNPFDPEDLRKEDYREWFRRAISTLPPKQMKIMELLLEEVPITSNDPGVRTISKELGKAEKTIRNQRDQALDTLRRRFVRKESQQ